jgi:hypothetical protein
MRASAEEKVSIGEQQVTVGAWSNYSIESTPR